MSDITNCKRTDRPFEVGDYVMLNTKTFKLIKPSPAEKFLPRFCGPFRVSQRVGLPAYKLVLPPSCKIHPVAHVSKLWQYTFRPNESQHSPPVLLENADTFHVLDILSHRGSPKNRQCLVQWKVKDVLYNTWEPKSALPSCSQLSMETRPRQQSTAWNMDAALSEYCETYRSNKVTERRRCQVVRLAFGTVELRPK